MSTRSVELFVLLLLASAGCNHRKVDECNRLVSAVNEGVRSLEQIGAGAGTEGGVAQLAGVAETMDRVSNDVSKLEITLPELSKAAADYRTMATGVAQGAREIIAAASSKSAPRMAAAQSELQKSVKQEDAIVDAINTFCQGQ